MLFRSAPPQIRRLEAVQTCTRKKATCAYVEPTVDFGVLTLICRRVAAQILFANHLSSLRFRNGVLIGECSSGSWGTDFGLPGCYPSPLHPSLPTKGE